MIGLGRRAEETLCDVIRGQLPVFILIIGVIITSVLINFLVFVTNMIQSDSALLFITSKEAYTDDIEKISRIKSPIR